MAWNPNQKFAMPMFNPWVPERVRPWIYLLFALFFQLSGGVYFASLQQMVGATGLLREDIQLVAMFGVVGVNMPFPFLFRYKLRFTNQQLLINAALVIAACNLLCMWLIDGDFGEWRLPLLCAVSYIAGYFKLCGTFECFSNVRLWLSPKQDFGIFLPTIYIIILLAMPLSNWIDLWLIIAFDSWQLMHWLTVGLMLVIVFVIYTSTHGWRMMPHQVPLISLDWLGCYGALYAARHHPRHHRPTDAYPSSVSRTVDVLSYAALSHIGYVLRGRIDECHATRPAEHANRRRTALGIHHHTTVLYL